MFEWLNHFFKLNSKPVVVKEEIIDTPELTALKKAQYNAILDYVHKTSDANKKKAEKDHAKNNLKCPKCGHNVVVDHIQRIQGKIDGHMGGSLFGFGGSIHGSMDTNEVNFCTKCTHQWKKGTIVYMDSQSILDSNISWLRIAIQRYNDLQNVTFDELDFSEKFNSLAEKKQKMNDVFDDMIKNVNKFWGDTSIEVMHKFITESKWYYSNIPNYINTYYPADTLHKIGFKYAKEQLYENTNN